LGYNTYLKPIPPKASIFKSKSPLCAALNRLLPLRPLLSLHRDTSSRTGRSLYGLQRPRQGGSHKVIYRALDFSREGCAAFSLGTILGFYALPARVLSPLLRIGKFFSPLYILQHIVRFPQSQGAFRDLAEAGVISKPAWKGV